MKRTMYGLAAALLLMSGLTACANPLVGVVEAVAEQNSREFADEGEVELRELEVRKIEPDVAYVKEESDERQDEQENESEHHADSDGTKIHDAQVPLESVAAVRNAGEP